MLDLILKASFLVQLVMMILLGMSVISWAMIIKRSKVLSKAAKDADSFEDKFWSGADLSILYQNAKKRKDDLMGTEEIFYSGFTEFVRLRKSNSDSSDFVMEGTGRAMRVAVAAKSMI